MDEVPIRSTRVPLLQIRRRCRVWLIAARRDAFRRAVTVASPEELGLAALVPAPFELNDLCVTLRQVGARPDHAVPSSGRGGRAGVAAPGAYVRAAGRGGRADSTLPRAVRHLGDRALNLFGAQRRSFGC